MDSLAKIPLVLCHSFGKIAHAVVRSLECSTHVFSVSGALSMIVWNSRHQFIHNPFLFFFSLLVEVIWALLTASPVLERWIEKRV